MAKPHDQGDETVFAFIGEFVGTGLKMMLAGALVIMVVAAVAFALKSN